MSLLERWRRWRYDPYPDLLAAERDFINRWMESTLYGENYEAMTHAFNTGMMMFQSATLDCTQYPRRYGPEWPGAIAAVAHARMRAAHGSAQRT